MFTENALNLAKIISQDLDSKGYSLKVKTDSPLFDILQQAYLPLDVSNESKDYHKAIIKETASVEDGNSTAYDVAMNNAVSDLAPKLKYFIQIMKNQINPFIVSLGDKVINDLSKLNQNDLYGITIKEQSFPDILSNHDFLYLVEKRKDKEGSSALIPLKPLFPELSPSDVRTLITSFPGVTKDILSLIQNTDIDYQVYNGIFRHEYSTQGNLAYLFNSHPKALEISIITVILGILFANDPIEGTIATSEEYYSGLDTLISQASLGVSNYIAKVERAAKAGILVTGRKGNEITVNPMLYTQWMENGGDVEIIYGMALSKSLYETISDIDSKKDDFLRLWQNAKRNDQLDKSYKYVLMAKESFRRSFHELIDLEQSENVSLIGNDYDISKERFNTLVEEIKTDDLDEIYTLARKLVCRSRYPDLFVELFLEEIDKAAAKKDIPIKDAALLATIVYTSSVIANSIEITRL